ncbi:MAG TPA: hypothetical protein VGJ93_04780 [Desulfuromonadaceae bacterium]|jgi:hypothetical protein
MKRIIVSGLVILSLSTSAFAAQRVYLKDGGVIEAKSVWRAQGKIQVLVNRDTLAEFWPSEIDLKRTFAKHPQGRKKQPKTKTTAPGEAAATENSSGKSGGLKLPALPKMPERNPEMLAPGKDEGAIKKHKREMLERTNE